MPALSKKRSSVGTAKPAPLRKAPTLTLDEESPPPCKKRASLSRTMTPRAMSSKTSLSSRFSITNPAEKSSLVCEGADICTSMKRLDSGSHIGKTSSLKASGVDGEIIEKEESSPKKLGSKTVSDVSILKKSLSELNTLLKTTPVTKKPSLTKKKSSIRVAPMPPGGLIEIAFSFDTTGSMYSCLDEVKGRINDIVQRLQADIPGIRIAIIAHGDYCDAHNYIVKWIDFGSSLPELTKFVNEVSRTSGGDGDECYELVLRRAQEVLSWTPGSQRSLVLIGDAPPHEPGYRYGDFTNDIDWREEANKLNKMGVRIYSVGASGAERSVPFYKSIAETTGGHVLPLGNFNVIFDVLMTICYHEGGADMAEAYESEVRARHGGSALDAALEAIFAKIKDPSADVPAPTPSIFGTLGTPGISPPLGAAKALKTVKKGRAIAAVRKSPKTHPKKTDLTVKKSKKSAKTAMKKKTKTSLQMREKLNEKKFITGPLKRLKWSKWIPAVSQNNPPAEKWRKTKVVSAFFNAKVFQKDELSKAAMWEFGVRCPGKKKVYPVSYMVTSGVPVKQSWFRYMLTWPKRTRAAVKDVIGRGGSMVVRRGTFKRHNIKFIQKVSQYAAKKYDYAWKPNKDRKSKCRNLRRCGFVVSSHTY